MTTISGHIKLLRTSRRMGTETDREAPSSGGFAPVDPANSDMEDAS